MTNTEQRIREWLADPANVHSQHDAPPITTKWFDKTLLRNRFVTTNGRELSIQQSATHYCDTDSVELWYCPPHPLLAPYGDGEDPYGWVPISVVAQYIDALEAEASHA